MAVEWIAELVEEELKSIDLADIEHGIEDVCQLTVYLTSLAHRVAQRQRDLDREAFDAMRHAAAANDLPCECTDRTPDTGGYRCRACGGRL